MREFKYPDLLLVILLLANVNCVPNTVAPTLDELSEESSSNGRTLLHRRERDADVRQDVTLKVNHFQPMRVIFSNLLRVFFWTVPNFLYLCTQINNLNDTHQQLIVHWVGEGSSIIICLARDSKEATRRAKMPSAVYYSYDYGDTFENKTDLFKNPGGTFVLLDKFYIHIKSPSRVSISFDSVREGGYPISYVHFLHPFGFASFVDYLHGFV